MKFLKYMFSGIVLSAAAVTSAHATVVTVFDGIASGRDIFDATVTGAGATVSNDIWSGLSSGLSIDRGDQVITRNDGSNLFISGYGTMSGEVASIDPSGSGGDPLDYFGSGVTLTFSSAVNAIGFEVGDWATCCHVSELFISFDGGLPILVGSAAEEADGLFPSQADPSFDVFEMFVAAFDDTGDFTEVSFWGNGVGEVLVFGGDVRYALLDQGSLPDDPSAVPLPAGGLLLLTALGGIAALRRRKQAQS